MNDLKELKFENAKVLFRNFSGSQTDMNKTGNIEFNLQIDDEDMAMQMLQDGWNVKTYDSKRDGIIYHLPVRINFDSKYPPQVFLVSYNGVVTRIYEDTVRRDLDGADINYIDAIINPSYWEVNGKTGIKAYLRKMYVVLNEDELAAKYEHPRDGHEEEVDDDEGLPFK